MTRAERIRRMHAEGRSPKEIAALVERMPNYVRSVMSKERRRARLRKNGLLRSRGRPKKVAL